MSPTVSTITFYLMNAEQACQRDKAIKLFLQWGGVLPTTPEVIVRYMLKRQREVSDQQLAVEIAAVSRWHIEHQQPDPTKAKIVSKLLRQGRRPDD